MGAEHLQYQRNSGEISQEIYAVVVRVFQMGCIFLQRVMRNTGDVFVGVYKLLQETFLPLLFFVKPKSPAPFI